MPASFAPTRACSGACAPRAAARTRIANPVRTPPGSPAWWRARGGPGDRHRAPLSLHRLHRNGFSDYPTMRGCCSEHASAGTAPSLASVIGDAHRAGLPFRLTEVNSVTAAAFPASATRSRRLCGPRTRCSSCSERASTASTSTSERRDQRGIRIQAGRARCPAAAVRAGDVPPCAGDRSQSCRSPDARQPADAREGVGGCGRGRRAPRAGDRQGRPRARVALRIAPDGPAAVQRLLSPSVAATAGVTLAGQSLDAARTLDRPPRGVAADAERGRVRAHRAALQRGPGQRGRYARLCPP